MEKILEHVSDAKHYTSDACVVWCFDARFSRLLERFMKDKELQNVDLLKIAGGAKDLAAPEREADREYLRDQIRKSVALHHAKKIMLMVHDECGAYGGRRGGDFYEKELTRARDMLQNYFREVNIDLPVELYYADFEGLHAVN